MHFDKAAEPGKRPVTAVVAEPCRQLVRRDAGDLVADAVEAERAVMLLDIVGVELIEIGVGRRATASPEEAASRRRVRRRDAPIAAR